MAKTFTGTSTGNTYVEGQSYVSAGRVYTAQADGTFRTTNSDGTVRYTVGSSQDSGVIWGSTGGLSQAELSERATYRAQEIARQEAGSGPGISGVANGPSRGPGSDGVTTGGAAAPGAGPGNPGATTGGGKVASLGKGAVLGSGFLSGMPTKTTPLFAGGYELPRNSSVSDGGDFEQRWGEWGGGLAGLGVMVADGATAVVGAGWQRGVEISNRVYEVEKEFQVFRDSGTLSSDPYRNGYRTGGGF